MSTEYTARIARMHALIEADTERARCSPAERETVGEIWRHRAAAELRAATSFDRISAELAQGNADPQVVALAERAVLDERHHSDLSRLIAEYYLGRPVAPPVAEPDGLGFASCNESTARILRVVLVCCFNESIASAYLRECLRAATSPLIREAIRELLRDEVDHARLGWAHLSSSAISPAERQRVAKEVPSLVAVMLNTWDGTPSPFLSGFGQLSPERTRDLAREAIDGLVLPGFELLGIGE